MAHTLTIAIDADIDLSFLARGRMELGSVDLCVVRPHATEGSGKRGVGRARTLHGKSFAHDRAATSEDLQIRHAASATGRIVGSRCCRCRRETAESGRARLLQERAHGA